MKFRLLFLALLFSVFSWGQVNITPIRTDVSGFAAWTDTNVVGTTYLQLLVAGANAVSPTMNFDLYSSETLDFKARTFGGTTAAEIILTVSISINNGGNWTVLGTISPTTNTLLSQTQFDLSSYSGNQIKVKFSVAGTDNVIGVGIDDITIRGIAIPTGYSVTYSGNANTSGTVPTDATSYASGDTVTVKTNSGTLVKTGYTFAGWNTLANGSGTNYAAGTGTFSITTNTTLYAKWTPNNNTITFDGNGSDGGSTTSQTLATAATANLTTNGYTRTGYTFSGWATTSGGSVAYADGASYTMGTGNVTLYAVWQTTSPFITTTGTLAILSTTYGTASANTTFTVSAGNLTNTLIITPPSGFEVSTSSGAGFTTSLDLGTSNRTNTIIYVRLAATTPFGTYSGNVALTSTGVTTVNVATASSNVNKKGLTITGLSGVNKVYDGSTTASLSGTAALSGILFSDNVTISGSPNSNFSDQNVGTGKTITTTGYTLSGLQSGNYSLTQPTATANITAKALSISAPTITSKVYNGSAASGAVTVGTLLGLVGTETLGVTATGVYADANAGTGKTATITYLLSNGTGLASNYSLANGTGSGDITKANPVFTTSTITVSVSGTYTLPGANVVTTSDGTLSYTISGGGFATLTGSTINGVSIGSETLTVNQGASANYNAGSTTVTVTVATVVYTTNDYKTITGTGLLWGTAAHWQRSDGSGGWNAPGADGIPSSTRNVYIYGSMSTNGSRTSNKIIVESTGVLTVSASSTCTTQTLVKSGGTLQLDASLTNSGALEVEDSGTLIINFLASNVSPMWSGTENFHPNSTVMIKEWSANNATTANRPVFNGTNISTSTYNGYTAVFGNLSVDLNASSEANTFVLISGGVNANLAHNNLNFYNPASGRNIAVLGTGTATSGIGGDFYVDDLFSSAQTVFLSTSGNLTFTIEKNMNLWGATTSLTSSTTATTLSLNVNGDIYVDASAVLNFMQGVSGNPAASINLKGDIQVLGSGLLQNINSSKTGNFNFTGTGNGLTAASTQTIDIASTSANENRYINFNVKIGSYTQLINRNFELGINSKVTVEDGGVLDFGYTGTTPLRVGISGTQTGTSFASLLGSTLKITSPDGINTAGTSGNVQVPTITFDPTATFHYIGKVDQVTGTGIGSTGTGKAVIVELDTNSLQLSPSQSFGITNGTYTNINGNLGGILDIRKGKFIESTTAYITGSTGGLSMADGTYYQIPALSSSSSDLIPRLDGLSTAYSLLGSSTIELNGADGGNAIDQYFRGQRTYRNLTFSNAGVKRLSTGITNLNSITGTVTVKNAAILDVSSNTLGGPGTNLTMTDTAQYRTSGVGTKPDPEEVYTLGANTKVEFYEFDNTVVSNTIVRLGTTPTPAINYANVIINGPKVLNNSTNNGLQFQAGGTFTVKGDAIFKLLNVTGFYNGSSTTTAVKSTNTPTITLDDGSAIEYTGDNQTISFFNQNSNPSTLNYTNLIISGSITSTKTVPVGSTNTYVNENLIVNSSKLLLNVNEAITVKKAVNVALTGATFEIKDKGQLVQVDDIVNGANIYNGSNAGNIIYNRTASSIKGYDYVYWGSPVAGQDVSTIYSSPSPGFKYFWNPTVSNINTASTGTSGNWQTASGAMTPAKGYIVRGSSSYGMAATDIPAVFTGVPNNGQILTPISRGGNITPTQTGVNLATVTNLDDNWNLVGNPYPSAIDALSFLSDNSNLTVNGFVWLWRHNLGLVPSTNVFYGSATTNYDKNAYIAYNSMGSTPAGFNGKIAAGQGFFVSMVDGPGAPNPAANQTVTFKNTMRKENITNAINDNAQFYKSSSQIDTNLTDGKHRIWLDLVDANSNSVSTLIGYATGATLGLDRMYDAFKNIANEKNIYSLAENQTLIIQGRPTPFDENDLVPIGVNITEGGAYKIAITAVDGLFEEGQPIYLEDRELNIIHDLRAAPYSFAANAGIFDDRFVLRYTNEALGTPDFETIGSSVVVSTNHGNMNIKSYIENIEEVTVYDVLGRQLFFTKAISNKDFVTSNITMSQQTLIVKIKLESGVTVTRKIIL